MPNPWGQRPERNKDALISLVLGIIIFAIVLYLIFPNLFSNFFSSINSNDALTTSDNIYPSNPNFDSSQLSPDLNNNLTLGNGNSGSATGYSLLFVSSGQFQQLSLNAQDYAFIQELIQKDKNGAPTNEVFLVENGQIQKYQVSNEIYTIILNMATIITRSSNTPGNSTPSPSTAPTITAPTTDAPTGTSPATAISEILTVGNVSTTGFTVMLNPNLNGLTVNNFTLVNSSGVPITLSNAATSNGGASYTISAALSAGQTYSLTAAAMGFTFGAAQNITVP